MSKKNRATIAIQNRWTKTITESEQCRPNELSTLQQISQPIASTSKTEPIVNNPINKSTDPTLEKSQFNTRISDLEKSLDYNLSQDIECDDAVDYKIVNTQSLAKLFSSLLCPECKQPTMKLKTSGRCGFAYSVMIECDSCLYTANSFTSDKIEASVFDINRRMVKFFLSSGQGFSAMERFCMAMNIEGLSNNAFNKHATTLTEFSKLSGNLNLERARERV